MAGQLIAAELVYRSDSGEPMTDTLIVAAQFGYEHRNVLRKVDQLDCTDDFRLLNFEQTHYLDAHDRQGDTRRSTPGVRRLTASPRPMAAAAAEQLRVGGAEMTCLSCRYSVRLASGLLWCVRERRSPLAVCALFVYEPGTDQGGV